MKNNRKSFLVLAGLTLAAVIMTLYAPANSIFRLLFALPLVFVLPGYAILAAVSPGYQAENNMERWIMSIGLSMGITILSGFLLNLTPSGLQPAAWSMLLASITLIGALLAFFRSSARPAIEIPFSRSTISLAALLLLALSAALVVGAIGFSRSTTTSLSENFTQLWMLPAGKGQANALDVGITNMESSPIAYHLVIKTGSQVIWEWTSIQILPGHTWNRTFDLPPAPGNTQPVQAFLYRLDRPAQVYRTATWWPGS